MITIHERHRQTDGQTDRQTDDMQSQYRAMHIVHRAVKTGLQKLECTIHVVMIKQIHRDVWERVLRKEDSRLACLTMQRGETGWMDIAWKKLFRTPRSGT